MATRQNIKELDRAMSDKKACNSGKTVFVIDDDLDFLLQQKMYLESVGYTVKQAESMEDGQKLLDEGNPDLIIIDLMMEEQDSGFTFCYHAKKQHPDLPIIMVTGVASETGIEFDASTEEERSWVKADAILSKPIRFEQLQGEIDRLLHG